MSQNNWAATAEQQILDAALQLAPEHGWGGALAWRAAASCGFSRGEAELLLPHGSADLAALLSQRHDQAALAALVGTNVETLKIRDRIRAGVLARLEATDADTAAVRRCVGFLALPAHVPLAMRLAWASADAIWRWAGDTSTDENHYTKRAILVGVLTAVLAADVSHGRDAAKSQLEARIGNVMSFEKWKAGLKPADAGARIASLLARLRYGRPKVET